MTVRWFVYDIRGQLEEFCAAFADRDDAVTFGRQKFGEHAYVTDVSHHNKIKSKNPSSRKQSWKEPK